MAYRMRKRDMRWCNGFTIIELIAVIVLVPIVGVAVVGRFLRPNEFNESAATNGLITTIRAAQQAALGRTAVTFEADMVGNSWILSVNVGGDVLRTLDLPTANVNLETGSAVASTDSCATSYDTPVNDLVLAFDNLGNLATFTNGVSSETVDTNFNGVRICVNDTNAASVCVSPAGYAHKGNCDE